MDFFVQLDYGKAVFEVVAIVSSLLVDFYYVNGFFCGLLQCLRLQWRRKMVVTFPSPSDYMDLTRIMLLIVIGNFR